MYRSYDLICERSAKCSKITLSLLSTNKTALSLYIKNGFVQEGLLKREQYKDGKYQDVILMAKFFEI